MNFKTTLLLLMALFVASVSGQTAIAAKSLRVGVYENAPKLTLNQQGQVSGIFGDMLQLIAAAEGWTLEAVPCHFDDCLRRLERGEIDLLPDLAVTDDRGQLYNFHQTAALHSWSQIYVMEDHSLSSLLELDGKRLALLRGSVQYDYLQQLVDSFGINVGFVLADTQQAAFVALLDGVADAVTANNFIGEFKTAELGLKATPIMFQPIHLFFAAPQGQHNDVLAAIDSHLHDWLADNDSAYFDILRHWNASMERESIPQHFWWLVIALLLGFVSAVLFSLLMWRRIVEKNTSLRQAQQNLNLILDSVDAHIFIKDMQQRYQYVNQNMCKFSGRQQHEIIGQTDSFLYTEATCQKLRENDRRVLEEGERVVKEELNMLHGADSAQTFLTVKLPLRREDGTIYSLCGISTNMTDYLEIQKQLRRLALYDGLTGLANRYSLLEHLEKLLTDSHTAHQDGALLIVDLDAFKTLNDTLGHHVGDLLLKCVAERLQAYASEQNLVARLGADEFVLVRHVPGSNRAEVTAATQQFADTLLQDFVLPFSLGKTQYTASATIGIALFSDAEGEAKQLLQKAEIALYRAKASGRNSVCFFDPLMQQQIQRHSQLEHWLREAITLEQLELYVQPQVSSDQQCVGMEALLRWNHPEEGFIAPADFIPIAEASGLIYPLGDWVLRKACQILADWSTIPGMENLTLSVNISPRQFRHRSFVEYIDSCIAEFSVDPSYLELEVTESLLIEDIELTIGRMNALRKRGLRFSLDDFGTGYASLSYLKLLPFNKLKIDQSFVQDVLTDINDEAIVSTIITLGQSLDLAVVAEGVETVEQAMVLEHYGCYVYQGYYFGKPAPVIEWQQRISNNWLRQKQFKASQ